MTSLDQLTPAVERFIADRTPSLLDVRIDGGIISGPYLRSVFGRDE